MNAKPRFVFDANALVSALLFRDSTPDRALRKALSSGETLLSDECIAELSEVLSRPKFDRYLTREERDLFLTKLIQRSILVDVTQSVKECRDPQDDKYLALAAAGQAQAIVSGDSDLLSMKVFQGIPILSPAEFLSSG